MAELAQYKIKEIEECRQTFEAAVSSDTFVKFINNAVRDIDFYEGSQVNEDDQAKLEKAGITMTVTNLIAPRIDAVAGKEVSVRTRFKYRGRSGNAKEAEQAEAISQLALYVQEKNRTSRLLSQAKHHARICGLGWHSFDIGAGTFTEMTENPLDVVWDTRDHTPLLSNQGFVARVKWMTMEEAQKRFPKRVDELDRALTGGMSGEPMFAFGASLSSGASSYRLFSSNGYWNEADKVLAVIEFQYREPATYYRVTTDEGMVFDTFDKEMAYEKAGNKKAVVEQDGYKVCFAYFSGKIDLDYLEAPVQIDPAKGLFLLTPVVYARSIRSGVPYGLVGKAIDIQRAYNTTQSKIKWLMAARGVMADKGAFDDPDRVAKEINNPAYFITKNQGKEVKVEIHGQEIIQHTQMMTYYEAQIQRVLGIFDEALGVETNAQSGVAIQKRQTASAATQQYATDGFNEAQRGVAEKMLGLIRGVFSEEMAVNITDDEGLVKTLEFNRDKDGVTAVDVRMGEYDVVIEQVPDADTMNDIAREYIMELVRSGVRLEQVTPGWLDLMNVPKTATLRKEIEQGVQQKLQELDAMKAQQQKIGNGIGPVPMGGQPELPVQPKGMS